MKIELTTPLSGINYDHRPGDVIDVPEDEGRRHIAAGNAIAVDAEASPVVETATVATPETTAARKSAKARK